MEGEAERQSPQSKLLFDHQSCSVHPICLSLPQQRPDMSGRKMLVLALSPAWIGAIGITTGPSPSRYSSRKWISGNTSYRVIYKQYAYGAYDRDEDAVQI
jgi:hypothetical protein